MKLTSETSVDTLNQPPDSMLSIQLAYSVRPNTQHSLLHSQSPSYIVLSPHIPVDSVVVAKITGKIRPDVETSTASEMSFLTHRVSSHVRDNAPCLMVIVAMNCLLIVVFLSWWLA